MKAWLGGILLAVALLAGHAPPALADADLDSSGWWWRAQTGLLAPLPPPPGAPDDGLVVAGAPDGPAAVSAIRFHVDDGEVLAATLTLDVASDQGGAAGSIDACPAAHRWMSARAGPWDSRPEADCEAGSVAGAASDDGQSWFFDVAPLIREGVLDIVLQAPGGAPFQVAFEAPSPSSLEVTAVSEPVVFSPSPAEGGFAPPPADSPPPAFDAPAPQQGFMPFSPADAGSPDPGTPAVAAAEPQPEPAPAAPEATQAQAAPTVAEPVSDPVFGDGKPLGVVLLLVTLGAAALLQRQQAPAAVGLGRFTRPRSGAPPPLR